MHSSAQTVDAYIDEAPPERRGALGLLRKLCVEELDGFDEVMAHGMPGYMRAGEIEIAFASQKAHISVYVLRQAALSACAGRLAPGPRGTGRTRMCRRGQ